MNPSDVVCTYKDKCVSFPEKCVRCKHNKGKKDYFEPM